MTQSKQSITLTRALVEVKTLNDRIAKAIAQVPYVALAKGRKDPRPVLGQFKTVKELEDTITSAKQSLDDLIKRRSSIKSAIARANVETMVTINGITMSIFDAIDYKATIAFKESILITARKQLAVQANNIEANRIKLEGDIQKSIENLLGVEGKTKAGVENNAAMIEGTKNAVLDMHDLSLVDPLSVSAMIIALEKEISEARAEIDFALSEINSQTKIEI